jgi:signal transduction histidine kinase
MLAHELRNPLAPIVQSIQLASEPRATDAQKGWALRVIDRQVRHMSVLLDDLLDVSRITRGHLELRRRPVQFKGIIESAVETARPLIDARAHSLEVHIDETDQPIVVDPDRIAQVVSNLLTNAAKYTTQGGAIRLRCVRDGDGVELSVEDNGVGLDPRALDTVFEMFAQVEATRSMASGLGIGLALARAVVQLHGGTLVATSEGVGKGSRFVMRLPSA